MTLKIAYNTTETPALVDAAGYQIGGRSWGPVDSTDELARAEFAAGRLVDVDEDLARGSEHPDLVAAVAALDARRARFDAARELDKAELVEGLDAERVEAMETGGDGLPAKDDLVDATVAEATASGEDVPAAEKKKTTTRRSAAQK